MPSQPLQIVKFETLGNDRPIPVCANISKMSSYTTSGSQASLFRAAFQATDATSAVQAVTLLLEKSFKRPDIHSARRTVAQ